MYPLTLPLASQAGRQAGNEPTRKCSYVACLLRGWRRSDAVKHLPRGLHETSSFIFQEELGTELQCWYWRILWTCNHFYYCMVKVRATFWLRLETESSRSLKLFSYNTPWRLDCGYVQARARAYSHASSTVRLYSGLRHSRAFGCMSMTTSRHKLSQWKY